MTKTWVTSPTTQTHTFIPGRRCQPTPCMPALSAVRSLVRRAVSATQGIPSRPQHRQVAASYTPWTTPTCDSRMSLLPAPAPCQAGSPQLAAQVCAHRRVVAAPARVRALGAGGALSACPAPLERWLSVPWHGARHAQCRDGPAFRPWQGPCMIAECHNTTKPLGQTTTARWQRSSVACAVLSARASPQILL